MRPKKVLEAAKYLVSTSELFKSEGIEVHNAWQNTVTTEAEENDEWDQCLNNDNIKKDSDKNTQTIENNNDKENASSINSETIDNDDDNCCEVDERPSGVTDTLLQEPEIAENGDNIISFAPGEGNKPLGIFMDKDSEFLSFPTIFCGKRRADNKKRKVPVSYSTIAKWELRCQDRRAAQSVPNLFYKLKKLQIKQIQDTASISLRKCKTKGKKYTAGDLNSEDYVNKLIHLDVMLNDVMPVGQITDYFYRVEFQQIGSPHIHGLFWVKGAPQYGKSSEEEIVSFIDKYVTCQKARVKTIPRPRLPHQH